MFNPYAIILGLFTLSALGTTIWGAVVMIKARKSQHWPSVKGLIEESHAASDVDDLLPHILFSYTINDQRYQKTLPFPSGTVPSPELSKQYLERYPQHAQIDVYYDPGEHSNAILEPGMQYSDWMIFAFGAGSLLLMVYVIFFE